MDGVLAAVEGLGKYAVHLIQQRLDDFDGLPVLPGRLGVPVSHAHCYALVQAEEVAEVRRKILQERQLV